MNCLLQTWHSIDLFTPCFDCMCRLRIAIVNPLKWHCLHANGLCWQRLSCICLSSAQTNRRPHFEQVFGSSTIWVIECLWGPNFCAYDLEQLNGLSPLSTRMFSDYYFFRLFLYAKKFEQTSVLLCTSHWCGLSPVWIFESLLRLALQYLCFNCFLLAFFEESSVCFAVCNIQSVTFGYQLLTMVENSLCHSFAPHCHHYWL